MIPTAILLRNYGPFRGEHRLDLAATHYGIVAATDERPGRSNWLGKTTLASAVAFVLHGDHAWRLEDDLITDAENIGGVELVTDTGLHVARMRTRGEKTLLTVGQAKDKAAQDLVDRAVGLAAQDFPVTCYFRQKQMSRFVVARPGERSAIVRAWLALDPLERCAARARAEVGAIVDEMRSLRAVVDEERRFEERLGSPEPRGLAVKIDAEIEEARRAHRAAAQRLEVAEATLVALQGDRVEQDAIDHGKHASAVSARFGAAQRMSSAVRDACHYLTGVPHPNDPTREWWESIEKYEDLYEIQATGLQQEAAQARVTERHLAQVASASFDGTCPVLPGFACPAKEQINHRAAEAAASVTDAAEAVRVREKEATRLQQVVRILRDRRKMWESACGEAASADQAVQLFAAAAARHEERLARGTDLVDQARKEKAAAQEAAANALRAIGGLEAAQAHWAKVHAAADAARGRLAALSQRLAALRAAANVYGRNGAQRAIAEGALARVEARANASLSQMGVALRVGVSWGREAEGLAAACDDCGLPFPASAKAKECARCGAPRGEKRVDRLDLDLSDVSGAAEDLAGVAFQLAASEWLRARRGAPWASAILDEPVGALDEAHRRDFGRGIGRILGAHGFAQSLVVAHHADVLDALPGRIAISWIKGRPSIRVE